MKDKFFEYHMNDEDVMSDLINNATIVLDTNALLNLYKYNDDNRKKYFEVLRSVEDRLILPYQVGYEFYENRENIIRYKALFKEKMKTCFNDKIGRIEEMIKTNNWDGNDKEFHKYLQYEEKLKDELLLILDEAKNSIASKLDICNIDFEISWIKGNDQIQADILSIFENKICDQLSNLEEICKEAEEGYKEKNVPGYKDAEKNMPNKYGDYIIWKEMMKIAKKNKKDILFISNDRKEDWVYKINGIDLGTNRHLVKNFYKETSQLFFSIKVDDFIERISALNKIEEIDQLMEQTKVIEDYKLNNFLKNTNNDSYYKYKKAVPHDLIYYIENIYYILDRLELGVDNWHKYNFYRKIEILHDFNLISAEERYYLEQLKQIRSDIMEGENVDYRDSLVVQKIPTILNRLNSICHEIPSKFFMVCPRCNFRGYSENASHCPECGYNNDDY